MGSIGKGLAAVMLTGCEQRWSACCGAGCKLPPCCVMVPEMVNQGQQVEWGVCSQYSLSSPLGSPDRERLSMRPALGFVRSGGITQFCRSPSLILQVTGLGHRKIRT